MTSNSLVASLQLRLAAQQWAPRKGFRCRVKEEGKKDHEAAFTGAKGVKTNNHNKQKEEPMDLTKHDYRFERMPGYTGPTEHSHKSVGNYALNPHLYKARHQDLSPLFAEQRSFWSELPRAIRKKAARAFVIPPNYRKVWRASQDWTVIVGGWCQLSINPSKVNLPTTNKPGLPTTWCRTHFMGWDVPCIKMRKDDVGVLTTGSKGGGFVLTLDPVYPFEGYSLDD